MKRSFHEGYPGQYHDPDRPGKRIYHEVENPGVGLRSLKDTPGPVGERRRKESDKKYKMEIQRKRAHERVKRAVKELAELTKDRPMLTAAKTIAEAAQIEMILRLEEAPEKLPPTVLNRWADSAINTVARMEQWDRKKGDDPTDALAVITAHMAKLKGRWKIEVSVESDPDPIDLPETINVTPRPSETAELLP